MSNSSNEAIGVCLIHLVRVLGYVYYGVLHSEVFVT